MRHYIPFLVRERYGSVDITFCYGQLIVIAHTREKERGRKREKEEERKEMMERKMKEDRVGLGEIYKPVATEKI